MAASVTMMINLRRPGPSLPETVPCRLWGFALGASSCSPPWPPRTELPGELAKYAVSEGTKAVTKDTSSR